MSCQHRGPQGTSDEFFHCLRVSTYASSKAFSKAFYSVPRACQGSLSESPSGRPGKQGQSPVAPNGLPVETPPKEINNLAAKQRAAVGAVVRRTTSHRIVGVVPAAARAGS